MTWSITVAYHLPLHVFFYVRRYSRCDLGVSAEALGRDRGLCDSARGGRDVVYNGWQALQVWEEL